MLVAAALPAGETEFHPLDPTLVERAASLPETGVYFGVIVDRLDDNAPVKRAGLVRGDRIIALGGYGTVDCGELDLVALRLLPHPGPWPVRFVRGAEILERQVTLGRVMHLGFTTTSPSNKLDVTKPLRVLGETGPAPIQMSWQAFPRRILAEVALEQAAGRQTPWLQTVGAHWRALTASRWAEARPPIPPCGQPFTDRVTAWWGRLATVADAEPAAVDTAVRSVHPVMAAMALPLPELILPETRVAIPDAAFAAFMKAVAKDPYSVNWVAKTSGFKEPNPLAFEPHYSESCRRAFVHRFDHGGWPYRHIAVRKPEACPRTIAQLREGMAAHPEAAPLLQFALITALGMHDVQADHRDLPEARAELVRLQERDPALATLAVANLCLIGAGHDIDWTYDHLRAIPGLGVQPRQPSHVHAWLAERDPLGVMHYAWDHDLMNDLSLAVYDSMVLERPWWMVLRDIAAAVKADAPTVDDRVFADCAYLARCNALYTRAAELRAFAPRGRAGEVFDAFNAMLARTGYGESRLLITWIGVWQDTIADAEAADERGAMERAAAALDWSSPLIVAQIEDLRRRLGGVHGRLALAEACLANNRREEGERLRATVVDAFARIQDYLKSRSVNKTFRRRLAGHAALAMVGYPELLPCALEQAKEAHQLADAGLELHVAGIHAAVKAGQADLAREWALRAAKAKPAGIPLRLGATVLADEEQLRAALAADLALIGAEPPKPDAQPDGPEPPDRQSDF